MRTKRQAISRELFDRGLPDIANHLTKSLLRELPNADLVIIEVVEFGGDADDSESSGTLRRRPHPCSPPELDAHQMPLPFGSDGERERKHEAERVPVSRVRSEGQRNHRTYGEGESVL